MPFFIIENEPAYPHLRLMQVTSTPHVRPAAVAGMFYPGDGTVLACEVDALLGEPAAGSATPKALVVPHAGYRYSGTTAARAFRLLAAGRGRIRRVVILGPAHRA
ncbi:MAG: AmmeMemoRadiSam system protein B, partial [Gammaproteobacteria bacterium]